GHAITFELANHDGDTFTPGRRFPRTAPVGSFPPNAFGLHDMHGNVYDWCADSFRAFVTGEGDAVLDPSSEGGQQRCFRGGGWRSRPAWGRSASRNRNTPDFRSDWLGCRPVLVVERPVGENAAKA